VALLADARSSDMLHRLTVFLSLVALMPPQAAFAWGGEGHHIVAIIAGNRLTRETKQQIAQLLGPDETLVTISTWPDEIRKDHPETAGWHYVSVPKSAPFFDEARDCFQPDPDRKSSQSDHQNCVVDRIDSFIRVLRDRDQPQAVRAEALKYIVHFVGDIHQPMHAMGEGHGANDIKIVQFGHSTCGAQQRPCNLHGFWDSGLIDHTQMDEGTYAHFLEIQIAKEHLDGSPQGTPADWANESHRFAEGALLLDGGMADELYFDHEISVVNLRLAQAGIRLADLLNHSFTEASVDRK
jgi:nuclease S1